MMDVLTLRVFEKPPTQFHESNAEFENRDTWQDSSPISGFVRAGSRLWRSMSSSAYPRTLEDLSQYRLGFSASTVSWTDHIDLYIDLLQAEARVVSVDAGTPSGNLFELRRLTGFTWAQLARLLNVDRRTLHNWVKGARIREQNREHIAKTLEVLRFADRGSAELNAAALNERCVPCKSSYFETIRTGNYAIAKQYLSHGTARSGSWRTATEVASWVGEFEPLVMHADADGTEMIEPLPDEPDPMSRKRPIRRG